MIGLICTYISFVKSLLCFRCVLKLVTRLCEYRLQQMFAHYRTEIGKPKVLSKKS